MPERSRNANLDLLRAVAIVMVVIFHVTLMSPVALRRSQIWTAGLQHGVDVFFVLSGWLIGTLYWKERERFDSVRLGRFWLRRWARTIPPYLAALSLAWLAVFVSRGEPFDWRYLLFLQNYSSAFPFFSVSWSLCIEEHFYLFLPLLLWPIARYPRAMVALLVALILSATAGRWLASQHGLADAFGYQYTATHLRLEGLVMGFGAAYVPVFMPRLWAAITQRSAAGLALGLALLMSIFALGDLWRYRFGSLMMSTGLLAVLVFCVARSPGRVASLGMTKAIAVSSYSIYLTHALAIQFVLIAVKRLPAGIWFVYFPLCGAVIACASAVFYFTTERTSIALRDQLIPRRLAVAKPL